MSGEIAFYTVVEGNMGDRNDLDLWWKGGSLVCLCCIITSGHI